MRYIFRQIFSMSELRKANFDGLFFVTLTVVGWIDVFSRSLYANLVLNNLEFCQKQKGLLLYAYVIMTNHLHLLAAAEKGYLSEIIKDFKSFSAKEIIKCIEGNEHESRQDWLMHMFRFHTRFNSRDREYSFWQPGCHPKLIINSQMLLQKLEYIQGNPVRAGYVADPEHWCYSSANPRSPLKMEAI